MIFSKSTYLGNDISREFLKNQSVILFNIKRCINTFNKINFTKPETIPLQHWKRILWVAMDLKQTVQNNKKEALNFLETKHVTLLFNKPHGRFQLAFSLACSLLGARITSYFEPNFENQPNPADTGKVLSELTDMIIVHGIHYNALIKLASSSTVPLFPASSNIYCFQKALSDLMTLQERFNRLKGLILAWIGPPSSIFNTYLFICPLFGMNINYVCICSYGSGKMSPINWPLQNTRMFDKNAHFATEFKTAKDCIMNSHVIATSMHPHSKNQINMDLLKHANPNWIFIHTLPRSETEVTDDVFLHEKNLSWKTSENYLYVALSIILTSLQNYQPTIKAPDFDGST